jgi:hypothetical protein
VQAVTQSICKQTSGGGRARSPVLALALSVGYLEHDEEVKVILTDVEQLD